ncbi:hypothetical protein N9X93_05850 [Alphaproteobacteria bacterium]|nr:hypothetical protein [Alphaproteobacteria bacterium]
MGISPTLGNTELSKTYDCNTIELEAVIDQNASREDNLERLSQQFFQSVNRIEHCDRELQTDSDQSLSSSATDASADANADANADASASVAPDTPAQNTASPGGASTSSTAAQATPSSSLVGTSLAEDLSNMAAPSASNMAGTTPMADTADMGTETGTMTGTTTDGESETAAVTSRPRMRQAEPDQRLTNGKIPDDIPETGNDSVFEAQIRAAAMAETDPNTQKNLWNEYRRYKGLLEKE